MRVRQVFSAYDRSAAATDAGFAYCPRCASALTRTERGGVTRPVCPACGFVQFRNPAPGVVVVIVQDDRVLLGQRAGGYGAGKWGLPQGFIEFEEDFLTAAIREVKEETGLDIAVHGVINVVSNFLSPRLHSLAIILRADVRGGTLAPADDLTALDWFPLDEPLPPMAFEADTYIVQRYAATRMEGLPVDPGFASTDLA